MYVGNLYDFYMRVDSESAQPKRTEKNVVWWLFCACRIGDCSVQASKKMQNL